MVSISVCMIVKNEEAVLARCLDSLGDIADEIIIVDTGSTDHTKRIAGKYTDRVFDFAWTGDFSQARNFSLSKAVCDYIYVADADEVLDSGELEKFRVLKRALLPEVEIVEFAYTNQLAFDTVSNFDTEYRPKLFKRLRAFSFIDPIHETLRTAPVVYRSDIAIGHYPTSNHARRDLDVFARLLNNQTPLSPRLEMMYARELLLAGEESDFCAARPYFEAVLEAGGENSDARRRALCVLTTLFSMQNDAALLLKTAAPAILHDPPAEVCLALGDYFLRASDPACAAQWFEMALHGAAPELIAVSGGEKPLMALAACAESLGDAQQAEFYREQAEAWTLRHKEKTDG